MNLTPEQQELGRRNFLRVVAGTPALAALGTAAAVKGPVRGGPVRLGYVGMRRSIASVGVLVGAAACRAIDQAGATAEAMQLRGEHGLPALSPAFSPRESCTEANVLVAGCGAIAVIASLTLGRGAPW